MAERNMLKMQDLVKSISLKLFIHTTVQKKYLNCNFWSIQFVPAE